MARKRVVIDQAYYDVLQLKEQFLYTVFTEDGNGGYLIQVGMQDFKAYAKLERMSSSVDRSDSRVEPYNEPKPERVRKRKGDVG